MSQLKIRTRPEPTFRYFYAGTVLIVTGLLLIPVLSVIPAMFIVLCGIFLLLSVKGVIIDLADRRVKPYFNFLFIPFGAWEPLDHFTHIVLGPNNQSQTLNHRAGSTTFRTRSYSVSLLHQNNNCIELREFVELYPAQIYLYDLAQKLNLPVIDKEELIRQKSAERRAGRRR